MNNTYTQAQRTLRSLGKESVLIFGSLVWDMFSVTTFTFDTCTYFQVNPYDDDMVCILSPISHANLQGKLHDLFFAKRIRVI